MSDASTTLVIGFDGATWRLLDRWIDAGELPNLQRIRSNSIAATLTPCLPPVTCPNWKCYATGKNPGKLGVFWWEIIDVQTPGITLPDSQSFDSPEIWDYLSDSDREVGVVNMPLTFPPHEITGTMVSRGSANDQQYTYPDCVKDQIEKEFNYKVNAELGIREEGYADEILNLIDTRFDVLEWILETKDPDFAHVTIFMINKLQHYFWDGDPTLEGWRTIDSRLSYFIDKGYNIIFTSDHGSNEIKTTFQANAWLEQEGYLTREQSETDSVNSISRQFDLNKRSLSMITARLGVRDVIKRVIPRSVIESLPDGASKVEKMEVIDWDQTKTLASGQGLIYLTEPESTDYEDIRADIVSDLKELEDPRTGRPIARNVYTKEEIYSGRHLPAAPDIVFDQSPGIHTEEVVGERDVFEEPTEWAGENEPDGIFMAYGPAFGSDGSLDSVHITDIMPTLLHLMGEPIPNDIDGEIIDIFASDSGPLFRDPVYRDPLPTPEKQEKHSKGTEERLKDLGYLS